MFRMFGGPLWDWTWRAKTSRGLALRGADLRGAHLRFSEMDVIDLSTVQVTDEVAVLGLVRGADLFHASLRTANLVGVDGRQAILSEADLTNAILCGADLRRAKLDRAHLTGANLSGSAATENDDWEDYGYDIPHDKGKAADLTDADLSGADLTDADLSGADLTDANLADTILTNIFYDGSTVWPQDFNPPPSRKLQLRPSRSVP